MKLGVGVAFGLAVGLAAASAQQPAVKRTVLQQHDLSVAGREAVTARAEIPPNGATGRHSHPGEEIGYVLEGTVTLEIDGQPAKTLKAGDAFIIPAGTVHNGMNKTSANVTVLANYIVEKGKPLTTPAK